MKYEERFEILELAGSGGMGKVYRARDKSDDRIVALKVLRYDIEPDAGARFQREIEALERLDHPAIVRHVAHGENWMAMEWIGGEELRVRLKRDGQLAVGDVVQLARRIASALEHVHERGIAHRDVKPSNIILPTGFADAVLIDFGLARTERDDLTRTGTLVGTPTYMAPEQIKDEPITPKVDVFALACVMYQCLAQVTPFAASGSTAVLARVLFGEPVPLARIVPEVPPALADLVHRMLQKAAADRPTMGEVVRALGDLGTKPAEQPARLSADEQIVAAVIVAGEARDVGDEDETLRREHPARDLDAVRAIADRHGAQLIGLPDDTLLFFLRTTGAPTDLAARAADCARALRSILPLPLRLAIGRARTGEGVPIGEAIDRAMALDPIPNDIRIDDVAASLLIRRVEPARTLLGRATPCVGRDAELATLEGCIAQSANESVARVVLVTGPAGSGKSRIRQELLARIKTRVWFAQGDSVGAGAPFALAASILRQEAGIAESDSAETSRRKLTSLAGDPRFLGEIAGVRFPDDVELRAARGDPRLMGDRMQRAFLDLVDAHCREPLAIVLEDLQWGDRPTIAAIDVALRQFEERPLAIIAFARPDVHERFPDLWQSNGVLPLALAPLPKKAATRLAHTVLPDAPDEEIGPLVDRAAGNVFLLEELLRARAEGRGDELPATVIAMVQSRLAALDPEERRVLRAASILGDTFAIAGVRALVGGDARSVERTLASLERREILASRGTNAYAFRHALVREAAYAMLTDADKTLGHRLAAELDGSALAVAGHLERAGESERAAAAYLRAAELALESSDLAGAIEHAERGVRLGAKGETLGALRGLQAQAHHWRGDTEAMEAAATEAVALLSRSDPRCADAMTMLAVAKQRLGHTAELASVAESLSSMLDTSVNDRSALARAGGRVAALLFFAGQQELGASMLDLAERAARGCGADVEARIHQARAPHARQAGRPESAFRHADAAASAYRAAGDLRNACMMTGIRGYSLSELGAYDAALEGLEDARVTAERLGLPTVAATARSNLAVVLLRLGRAAEAEAAARAAIAVFEKTDRRHEGGTRAYLALVLREMGRLAEAESEARRAVEILDVARALQPIANGILSTILLASNRPAEALEAARAATRWSGNFEEGDALVRLALARALEATGDREGARRTLEEARALIQARAATIVDAELRRSFCENVPENAQILG